MKLRENLFFKLGCSFVFLLAVAGFVAGALFLNDLNEAGLGANAWFRSYWVQSTLGTDATSVASYYELSQELQADESASYGKQLSLEELAKTINLDGEGNFIWQLLNGEGQVLLSNLEEGASLVEAAGDNPVTSEMVTYSWGETLYTELEVVYSLRSELPAADIYQELRDSFRARQQAYIPVLIAMIAAVLLGIFLFGFLVLAAGCRPGGEKAALNPFDRVWLEIPLIALVISVWLWLSAMNSSDAVLIVLLGALTAGMLLATVLTIVRRVRAKRLYASTFLHVLSRIFAAIVRHIHLVAKVTGVFLLYVVTQLVLIIFMIQGSSGWAIAWFVWIMGNLSLIVLLVIIAVQYDKIKKATEKMAQGNLGIVVDEKEVPFFREMAHNLNSSGNAIKIAVDKSTHSERMKTELITNVSHDIKTPLTSIINYVDLLKTTNLTDPKALEYVDVLEHKSRRLAQLMADLVEASKVTAGVIGVNMESINLGELLKQASGEFESRFEERGIQLMCRLPEQPVLVFADGRHMWRVLDNLFGNAVKYALDGTRIYVDMADLGNEVVLSMKNISRDPLNINADELMERFVRGDQARAGEGSGLGLSIARSLMELQNGTMDIQIDGDLFKVVLTLRKM